MIRKDHLKPNQLMISKRMQNKNLRGAVIEIQSLEIRIFHVGTFCKSFELQLVQIKRVQVLKEIST